MPKELDCCEWGEEESPIVGYMSGLYGKGEDPKLEHLYLADYITWNATSDDVAGHLASWLAGKSDKRFHVFVKEVVSE